jgi:hypothetical protein
MCYTMNVSTLLFSMKKFFQFFQFVVFLMCYSVNEPTSLNDIFFPICFFKNHKAQIYYQIAMSSALNNISQVWEKK